MDRQYYQGAQQPYQQQSPQGQPYYYQQSSQQMQYAPPQASSQAQFPRREVSPYITSTYIGQYKKKSEGTAAAVSIIPGAGLIYVGRYIFGLLISIAIIALDLILFPYFYYYGSRFMTFILNDLSKTVAGSGSNLGWGDFGMAFGIFLIPVLITIVTGILSYFLARKYNEALITTAAPPWKF